MTPEQKRAFLEVQEARIELYQELKIERYRRLANVKTVESFASLAPLMGPRKDGHERAITGLYQFYQILLNQK